ncbi:MAG: DUF1836 domain-containing protein [Oscillospiraceae bacterium]|nr:DUF1836 domain-containing protein [Oscillospiraceae bacterium]MBQ8788785.1 DUF1836 domain-containing protein [Oscillospiraceae bacterium]
MKENTKEEIQNLIKDFSLPRYNDIPNVGLYLEQVVKYISEYLEPLGSFSLTGSMVSNYVKKGLVENPVKKQYDREQIAYLFFIAVAKNMLSMEDIRLLFEMQHKTYEPKRAYDYFCSEFENVLEYVFGVKENLDNVGTDSNDTKTMLRNTIIAVAYKVYLDKYLSSLHSEEN